MLCLCHVIRTQWTSQSSRFSKSCGENSNKNKTSSYSTLLNSLWLSWLPMRFLTKPRKTLWSSFKTHACFMLLIRMKMRLQPLRLNRINRKCKLGKLKRVRSLPWRLTSRLLWAKFETEAMEEVPTHASSSNKHKTDSMRNALSSQKSMKRADKWLKNWKVTDGECSPSLTERSKRNVIGQKWLRSLRRYKSIVHLSRSWLGQAGLWTSLTWSLVTAKSI